MGRLLELANQLTGEKVPPVPSLKNHMEPLQPAPLLVVPSVPPVPCEKHEVEKAAHESHLQKRDRPRLTNVGLQKGQREQMNAPANDSLPDDQPQRIIHTAATASPEWIAARDQHIGHLMICRDCYAPTSRYCNTGADLRQLYNTISGEPTV